MKPILALVVFIQLALATSFSDSNIASVEPKQAEEIIARSSTEVTGDASHQEPRLSSRQDGQPEAKPYVVRVTNQNNEAQINDTRTWLEGLVKDKSKMYERKFLPADIPEEELQKLWDEGRWDDEIEKYEKLAGWGDCYLDQAGYDEVKGKTEWIESVEDYSVYRVVEMSPIPENTKATGTLDVRKVEWGDWTKQDAAADDLVQASQWK
jgi:hypothetical protein